MISDLIWFKAFAQSALKPLIIINHQINSRNANKHVSLFCFLPSSDTNSSLIEPLLQEQVEKLNRQNAELSDIQRGDITGSGGRKQGPAELILNGSHISGSQPEEEEERDSEDREDEDDEDEGENFVDTEEEDRQAEDVGTNLSEKVEDDVMTKHREETGESEKATSVISEMCNTSLLPPGRYL